MAKKSKITHYADLIAKAKNKARAEVDRLEKMGFIVSDRLHDLIDAPTPAKIAKSTYEHLSHQLNLNTVHRQAKLGIQEVNKEMLHIDLRTPVQTDISYSDFKNPQRLAKKINTIINTKVNDKGVYKKIKSEDLAHKINLLMSTVTGSPKFPKPGMSNEFYEIDNDYDVNNPLTLRDSIKFKKIDAADQKTVKALMMLLSQPYTNDELHEYYINDAKLRGFYGADYATYGLGEEKGEWFNYILHGSHLWNIARAEWAPDSEQIKQCVKWLDIKLSQIQNVDENLTENQVADVLAAIMNEDDFFDVQEIIIRTLESVGIHTVPFA